MWEETAPHSAQEAKQVFHYQLVLIHIFSWGTVMTWVLCDSE